MVQFVFCKKPTVLSTVLSCVQTHLLFISGIQNTACKFINTYLDVDKERLSTDALHQSLHATRANLQIFWWGNTAFLTSKSKLDGGNGNSLGLREPKVSHKQ